jgi:hypothetical protein
MIVPLYMTHVHPSFLLDLLEDLVQEDLPLPLSPAQKEVLSHLLLLLVVLALPSLLAQPQWVV